MSKSKRSRRNFTSEQKAEALRRHLVEGVPISQICNEMSLQPSVFHQWHRQAMANLAAAVSGPPQIGPGKREKELSVKVSRLEQRLAKKDAVIAEISEEYVKLKNELGEP
jgi:transposase-like protein